MTPALLSEAPPPCPPGYVDLAQDKVALRRVFVDLGLAEDGEAVEAAALAGGVSSGIFRVDLKSGRYCLKQALPALKVAKEWRVPVERVYAEVDWLRTAGAIVPAHVPRVVGLDDSSKSFVMPFLGDGVLNWKVELLQGRCDPGVAQAVGDVLGRIHAATADSATVARRFANDANFHAIRLDPYLVEAARSHPGLASQLLATVARTAATRRVLVHGDVSPKNVLVGPEGPVLLDAECAWFGDPAFDVAFCLNHFLLKGAHMPSSATALMKCYHSFIEAYWGHVQWEPVTVLEARIAALLPGLALARIDGKSPVEYLQEPRRGVIRSAAIRLLQATPGTLRDLAGRWAEEFNL